VSFFDDDLDPDSPDKGTDQPTERRRALRRRGTGRAAGAEGGKPRRPRLQRSGVRGGGGAAVLSRPGVRLLLVGGFIVVLIIVLVLVVRGCQRSQLVDSYKSYLSNVTQVATASGAQGTQLALTLQNPRGDNAATLTTKLRALAADAQKLVDRSRDLKPPGRLKAAHDSLVTALTYRLAGVQGLVNAVPEAINNRNDSFAAQALSEQISRLLASDVVYRDSFAAPAMQALQQDRITGIQVPNSDADWFLHGANVDYATRLGAAKLLPALRGGRSSSSPPGTGGGNAHGLGLIKTVSLPSGRQLSVGTTNSLKGSDQLQWQVTVQNQGDFPESNINVTATYSDPTAPGAAETQMQTISQIQPGEQAVVTLPGPAHPTFDQPSNLKISVTPVIGEKIVTNNTADYPVTIVVS
jgi:hypothetical protein